jgi:hypothetical protein
MICATPLVVRPVTGSARIPAIAPVYELPFQMAKKPLVSVTGVPLGPLVRPDPSRNRRIAGCAPMVDLEAYAAAVAT